MPIWDKSSVLIDMQIEVSEMLGAAVPKVVGRLNADVVAEFESRCNAALEQYGNQLVLDFSALEYLSSAGLCAILTIGKKVKNAEGNLSICVPFGTVRQILELAGFNQIFPIHENLEKAMKANTKDFGASAAIRTDPSNKVKIICVSGRVDAERVPEFKSYYTPLLQAGNRFFVFNFAEVDYMSSAGLCVILELGKELKKIGGKMAIYIPKGTVRHILEISGFADMFPLCDSEEEAVWEVL
ncbi:MAG TPA: STAS domain-containing protein [Verrucomicrobiota bacterium]|nr:STAS domain-containing protein [Verrucomicrobiota bacterium]